MDIFEIFVYITVTIAFIASLLTLYNAAKLRTGILAISTYAFGAGMLCLSTGFALTTLPITSDPVTLLTVSRVLFFAGFVLLGLGSYKIYQMSKI